MTASRPDDQPAPSAADSRRKALCLAANWTVCPTDGGYGVYGDDRPLRTPAGKPVVVASRPLAEAIAQELQGQVGKKALDVSRLPNMRLTATAMDQVAPAREAHIAAIAAYGETELLCYRAEHPADLVEGQHAAWQPLLDWLAERFDARLVNTAGIMPQPQPAESLAALRHAVAGYDDLHLAALAVAVQTSGSLTVGLAMAEGRLDGDQAFVVAEFDESYQITRWGEEAEAAQRRAIRRADLRQISNFFRLVKSV